LEDDYMKVREIMSTEPVCCGPNDSAQKVATELREHSIGSMPVVESSQSMKLLGMITDRDLCCGVVADGLDPKTTSIGKFVSDDVVSCRDGENLDRCERLMQEHQLRRIPIVDGEGRCIGIVAQADLVLKDEPGKAAATVKEISRPHSSGSVIAA
jgi:CBS domain-containing protein